MQSADTKNQSSYEFLLPCLPVLVEIKTFYCVVVSDLGVVLVLRILMCTLQVTDGTFQNEDEQRTWWESLTNPFLAEHPEKILPDVDNWKLVLRFYNHDQGRHKSSSTSMEEVMERAAGDVAGSASMLGLEYEAKKTGTDPSVKHKQAVGRANTLISRLGKQIGVLESSLPAMKRRVGASQMAMVKAGLSQCRDAKEKALDILEDCKDLPPDQESQNSTYEHLLKLHAQLSEHIQAVSDVINQNKEPPIKGEERSSHEMPTRKPTHLKKKECPEEPGLGS